MKEKKDTLKSIRENLLFFGIDTAHLSDQELEDGIIESGNVISKAGFTVDEVLESMSEFNKVFK